MKGGAPGAAVLDDGRTRFTVWAPWSESVEVHIVAPVDRLVPMAKRADGYHEGVVDCGRGSRYFFRLAMGIERPDPASRFQPEGVHAASEVVDTVFPWTDDGWDGIPLEEYVFYEIHVGTFTPEGTFDAIIPHLDGLKDLGVTAIELMPVAQFPGTRNWGYDGVYPYAAQNSYGGPAGLKRLVDACHARGLAAVLDVVYNHLGPEGNYTGEFGPYVHDRYQTPWGHAMNFDGPHSDEVRRFFRENALQWVDEFHFDALRFDAVHAIADQSAQPFLQEAATAVRTRGDALGRRIHAIAESDLNDPRVIRPASRGGLGFDAQWSDDFHHALHTLLTGEDDGYYADFGNVAHLASALKAGYHFRGQFSKYRQRRHGADPDPGHGSRFVVCAQNHDQIGNRMTGDRLAQLVGFEQLKLAAGAVVLSPFLPLLFMGEEYGETVPFLYFTSHSDPALVESVRKGRREEFDDFSWKGEPPDPDASATFENSRLSRREQGGLRSFYRELFRLRATLPALRDLSLENVEVVCDEKRRTLALFRTNGASRAVAIFNFSAEPQDVSLPSGPWTKVLDAAEGGWQGNGTPHPGNVPEQGTLRAGPHALVVYTSGS
ncbi:MAG: malto-oligosyltrehalose trehalohydrolase [Thermoanaerobaculia bacterium]